MNDTEERYTFRDVVLDCNAVIPAVLKAYPEHVQAVEDVGYDQDGAADDVLRFIAERMNVAWDSPATYTSDLFPKAGTFIRTLVSPGTIVTPIRAVQPDFCWVARGELLILGSPCDDRTGRCGCDRAYTGIASLKSTTVGVVAEIDVEDLHTAAESAKFRESWDLSVDEMIEALNEISDAVKAIGLDGRGPLAFGSLVRIRRDRRRPGTCTFSAEEPETGIPATAG